MNRSDLPSTAFIDPTGANHEEVRALAERVLERVLEEAATAAARPPMPDAPTLVGIPTDVPDAPLDEDQLLEHLTALIRGSMNPAHPGYLGHMDPLPTTASVLGDLVAAAVNNNLLSLEMSPLFSRLESSLTEGVAHRFGLGERSGFDERIRGGHHIFTRAGVEEILNLQPKEGKAKPYQAKQVRSVILKYGLGGDRNE